MSWVTGGGFGGARAEGRAGRQASVAFKGITHVTELGRPVPSGRDLTPKGRTTLSFLTGKPKQWGSSPHSGLSWGHVAPHSHSMGTGRPAPT